jgi:hypothetical protein
LRELLLLVRTQGGRLAAVDFRHLDDSISIFSLRAYFVRELKFFLFDDLDD